MMPFPEHLTFPAPLHVEFPGFDASAFDVLEELRDTPTVVRYRQLKRDIEVAVMQPFRQYRDDLVVNWVLPNGVPLETDRNVFSRFPKNDFGAGGANSHVWLSFYRHSESRLTDAQIVHSLSAESFVVGLYLAPRMGRPWARIREMLETDRSNVLATFLGVLSDNGLSFAAASSSSSATVTPTAEGLYGFLREGRSAFWIRCTIPRSEVIGLGKELVCRGLSCVQSVWPAYRLLVEGCQSDVRTLA